jgi:hypothetical protein
MTSTTEATNNLKHKPVTRLPSLFVYRKTHETVLSSTTSTSVARCEWKMEDIQVPPGLLIPFLGAVQASISALLTIAIGVAAAQWGLLGRESSMQISRTCMNIFLPLLLISNLGGELHLDTVQRYIPILSKYSPTPSHL